MLAIRLRLFIIIQRFCACCACCVCSHLQTEQLTANHNPKEESERLRIRSEGIEIRDDQTRLNGVAVSRALGDFFVKDMAVGMSAKPDVTEAIVLDDSEHSYLIVASDGVMLRFVCFVRFVLRAHVSLVVGCDFWESRDGNRQGGRQRAGHGRAAAQESTCKLGVHRQRYRVRCGVLKYRKSNK